MPARKTPGSSTARTRKAAAKPRATAKKPAAPKRASMGTTAAKARLVPKAKPVVLEKPRPAPPAKPAKPATPAKPAAVPSAGPVERAAVNERAPAPAPRTMPTPPPSDREPVEVRVPLVATTPIGKKDQKHFEERLLEERGRLLKELGYLEANVLKQNQRDSAGDLSGYSFHMADLGTDAMEREKAFLFASAEGRALYDVDEALRRLYSGAYGTCETCGQPIARERLDVVPHARLCVRCKEREEKAGRSKAR